MLYTVFLRLAFFTKDKDSKIVKDVKYQNDDPQNPINHHISSDKAEAQIHCAQI
jgi:hypothetical protein